MTIDAQKKKTKESKKSRQRSYENPHAHYLANFVNNSLSKKLLSVCFLKSIFFFFCDNHMKSIYVVMFLWRVCMKSIYLRNTPHCIHFQLKYNANNLLCLYLNVLFDCIIYLKWMNKLIVCKKLKYWRRFFSKNKTL